MSDLRIGVIGAGLMGADHIIRIQERVKGAVVSAVVEPDDVRANSALEHAPAAKWYSSVEAAIAENAMDAVLIATPGQFHESAILPALQAGLPILCEKPLTPDAESALRIVEAEVATGRHLIQVGFMRRFDPGYESLKSLIQSSAQGELLGLHCAHRNPSVPETYHTEMLIFDSLVHEIDVVRFLTDSPIATVEVKSMKRNNNNHPGLSDPILVLLRTKSDVLAVVEMNVSVKFGYEVKTEAVFENGIAEIGRTNGMNTSFNGQIATQSHTSFKSRFAVAYDTQIQRWVNATKLGKIDGPSSWDGYLAAAAVEAGLKALKTGQIEVVQYQKMPEFYN